MIKKIVLTVGLVALSAIALAQGGPKTACNFSSVNGADLCPGLSEAWNLDQVADSIRDGGVGTQSGLRESAGLDAPVTNMATYGNAVHFTASGSRLILPYASSILDGGDWTVVFRVWVNQIAGDHDLITTQNINAPEQGIRIFLKNGGSSYTINASGYESLTGNACTATNPTVLPAYPSSALVAVRNTRLNAFGGDQQMVISIGTGLYNGATACNWTYPLRATQNLSLIVGNVTGDVYIKNIGIWRVGLTHDQIVKLAGLTTWYPFN